LGNVEHLLHCLQPIISLDWIWGAGEGGWLVAHKLVWVVVVVVVVDAAGFGGAEPVSLPWCWTSVAVVAFEQRQQHQSQQVEDSEEDSSSVLD
jgi:hypothetical protein